VEEPAAFRAVSVTVKLPADGKAWTGDCSVLVPPSPKLHDQDVGAPVDWSVKVTARPTTGDEVDGENEATGALPDGSGPVVAVVEPHPAATSPARASEAMRAGVDVLIRVM
jgi:hypothetical protein